MRQDPVGQRDTFSLLRLRNFPIGVLANTIVAYLCAIYLSPWLVGRWFRWILPQLGQTPLENAPDWYLQHLILITVIPAFIVGYFVTRSRFAPGVGWAWFIPTLVLTCKIITFHESSVLAPGSWVSYYFGAQSRMPTQANFLQVDTNRVLAQMVVTAPALAGIAYSFGSAALFLSTRILCRLPQGKPALR